MRFGAVIVVDSLGSGAIERAIRAEGWDVGYFNSGRNLGSAGNLDLRLRMAAALDLDWCYAVNHDGEVDPAKVLALVRHGEARVRVGAVYPLIIFSAADRRPDLPRRRFRAFGLLGRDEKRQIAPTASSPCEEVAWSSSNCALYRLQAIRDGIHTWPELWMGYEDLAIGWELQVAEWRLLRCADVEVEDHYEFRRVRFLGQTLHIADKPSWYMYYQLRNLVILARRSRGRAITYGAVAFRVLADVVIILLYRGRKLERLGLLLKGLFRGLHGETGKGPLP